MIANSECTRCSSFGCWPHGLMATWPHGGHRKLHHLAFCSHLVFFILCAFQVFNLAWDREFQTKLDYAWYTSTYQFFPYTSMVNCKYFKSFKKKLCPVLGLDSYFIAYHWVWILVIFSLLFSSGLWIFSSIFVYGNHHWVFLVIFSLFWLK